jgi:hypothetical protein
MELAAAAIFFWCMDSAASDSTGMELVIAQPFSIRERVIPEFRQKKPSPVSGVPGG